MFGIALDEALRRAENNSLVLLIDEYDAPLTHVLDDAQAFAERKSTLNVFFSILKEYNSKFRFVFITGILNFFEMSVFSSFNNLRDISFDVRYGALTGITQEELEDNFKEYIENAAKVLNRIQPNFGWNKDAVLWELNKHYDGYSFDRTAAVHVYNPWSILNFLKKPQNLFLPYWLDTGGSNPTLLIKFLRSLKERGEGLGEVADFLNPGYMRETYTDMLSPHIGSLTDKDFPFFAVLYQAGYFSIKKADGETLEVGIPNNEVRSAFTDVVVRELTQNRYLKRIAFSREFGKGLAAALAGKDFAALKSEFNKIINAFSYETIQSFKESSFRDVIKLAAVLLDYNCGSEEPNAVGRSDLSIKTQDKVYVFEIKTVPERDKAQAALEEAREQIKARRYGVRLTDKEVVTAALVIVNEKQTDKLRNNLREIVYLEQV